MGYSYRFETCCVCKNKHQLKWLTYIKYRGYMCTGCYSSYRNPENKSKNLK